MAQSYLFCSCHGPASQFLKNVLSKNKQHCLATSKKIANPDLKPVSIMYTGGIIRPMKNGNVDETVEAIGFHNGKVLAVGSEEEVEKAMKEVTEEYAYHKLENEALLPGLIEPHVHIVVSALLSTGLKDFSPFCGQKLRESYNPEWLESELKKANAELQDGYFILGQGVDPSLMPFLPKNEVDNLNVLQNFNVDTVDSMIKDTPVMLLSASEHSLYVNTAALRYIYQIVEPDTDFESYRDRINSAGGLQEKEVYDAFFAIPPEQQKELLKGLNEGLDQVFHTALERGVTMLYDAAMTSEVLNILNGYFEEDTHSTLTVPRIGYAMLIDNPKDQLPSLPTFESINFESPYQGSIKIGSDGSNQGLTGFQPEGTYRCEPKDNTGIANYSLDELRKVVKEVAIKKWPMMIHANGISAIKRTISAYGEAIDEEGGESKRHRIEHCSLSSKGDLQLMAELGISPSFLIGHVGYWGYAFTGIFEENSMILDQCQTALKNGLRITLHSDLSVSPLGPLRMMEQAITRIMEQDPQRKVLNPDERLTPAQALKAVTFDAAWQCHADKWVGSLEAPTHSCPEGKLADYVILSEDPVTRQNPVGMRDIEVLETWVGGLKLKG